MTINVNRYRLSREGRAMFTSSKEAESLTYICSICARELLLAEGRYICEENAVCPECHSQYGRIEIFRILDSRK